MDAFYLGSYSPDNIQPGGNLTLLGASAEQAGGRLRGAFRLLLPQSAAQLAAAPLSVLTAGAALGPDGSLRPHRANQARPAPYTPPSRALQPAERAP